MSSTAGITLFEDGYWDDHIAVTAAHRAESAVHRATLPGGVRVWVIGRYDEARNALADPRLSKNAAGLTTIMRVQLAGLGGETELSGLFAPHMLFADDPAHARLRRLVAKDFTRPRAEALRPQIEQIAEDLLARTPVDEPVDLVATFTSPLPLTVICDLLGVPVALRTPFRTWTAQLMHDDRRITVPASRKMAAFFASLIAAKRIAPGEDLLSALMTTGSDGDQLMESELMGTVFLLFVAGHETTPNLITNSVRWLMGDPRLRRAVVDEPGLIPRAVEEVLRYDSPVRMATHRFTTQPVTYGGVSIPAGELVLVDLVSANRDGRHVDRADVLDVHREVTGPGGHLSFDHGIHHCLGAALGRMEAEIALTQLTRRFPNARLAVPAHRLRRQHSAIMNGHLALPVLLA